MGFVIDASLTPAWCFADERTPGVAAVLERLEAESAVVPHFWPEEVANALLMSERRGRLTSMQASETLAAVLALNVERLAAPGKDEIHAIMVLARAERLTVYDACYLRVAMENGLPIASLDQEIQTAAQKRKVALIPVA